MQTVTEAPPRITGLVKIGSSPEIVRCAFTQASAPERGTHFVVRTDRGEELAVVVGRDIPGGDIVPDIEAVRAANEADLAQAAMLADRAGDAFTDWVRRIDEWKLDLQLIDVEWTLDGQKQILSVLNERGAESTRLALLAAAAGLGIVEVQPVTADGLAPRVSAGGHGCGSCGCG